MSSSLSSTHSHKAMNHFSKASWFSAVWASDNQTGFVAAIRCRIAAMWPFARGPSCSAMSGSCSDGVISSSGKKLGSMMRLSMSCACSLRAANAGLPIRGLVVMLHFQSLSSKEVTTVWSLALSTTDLKESDNNFSISAQILIESISRPPAGVKTRSNGCYYYEISNQPCPSNAHALPRWHAKRSSRII